MNWGGGGGEIQDTDEVDYKIAHGLLQLMFSVYELLMSGSCNYLLGMPEPDRLSLTCWPCVV